MVQSSIWNTPFKGKGESFVRMREKDGFFNEIQGFFEKFLLLFC